MSECPDQAASLRLRKLNWLCRRGMKELDVLLERFIAEESSALKLGQWPELEALLALEDDKLWDYLQQPESDEAAEFRHLLINISHGINRAN